MTDTAAPSVAVHGDCPDRFDFVRQTLADDFAQGGELGARFTACVDGAPIVDVWAGFADRACTRPFGPDTLTPVYSVTKLLAALLIGKLVGEGRLSYDQPVAEVWRDFGAHGKDRVTVAQALSHQAGLPGFLEQMDPALWADWDAVTDRLAAMPPMWAPGTASGYHAITVGLLAGEIFRRVDGRHMGQAVREDFAEPFGLDLWLGGLPAAERARLAELKPPPALPDFGDVTAAARAAFLLPWSSPRGIAEADTATPIPSVSGLATAEALARLMTLLACDGVLDGQQVLAPGVAAQMMRERIAGQDQVLPHVMSWAAGPMRNAGTDGFPGQQDSGVFGPGRSSVGHYGWGGACAFADPERRLSGAYVMNRQQVHLIGDPRARRLIDALYQGL